MSNRITKEIHEFSVDFSTWTKLLSILEYAKKTIDEEHEIHKETWKAFKKQEFATVLTNPQYLVHHLEV